MDYASIIYFVTLQLRHSCRLVYCIKYPLDRSCCPGSIRTHVPLTCNPDIFGLAVILTRIQNSNGRYFFLVKWGMRMFLPLRTGLSSFIADARQRTRDGAKISARLKELSQLSSGGNQVKAPKSAPKRKRSGESKALRQKNCAGACFFFRNHTRYYGVMLQQHEGRN